MNNAGARFDAYHGREYSRTVWAVEARFDAYHGREYSRTVWAVEARDSVRARSRALKMKVCI
jgi:hypothetical protein